MNNKKPEGTPQPKSFKEREGADAEQPTEGIDAETRGRVAKVLNAITDNPDTLFTPGWHDGLSGGTDCTITIRKPTTTEKELNIIGGIVFMK